MKVKCIDNYDREDCLTVGKIYDVQTISQNSYSIKNDCNVDYGYYKHRFEVITEGPNMDELVDNIFQKCKEEFDTWSFRAEPQEKCYSGAYGAYENVLKMLGYSVKEKKELVLVKNS